MSTEWDPYPTADEIPKMNIIFHAVQPRPVEEVWPEMKPCPFCGSPGKPTGECDMVWIVCSNWDCQAERINKFEETEDAIADWNERKEA